MKPSGAPLTIPLPADWTPRRCLKSLSRLPGCLALESALADPIVGRYSYVAADPIAWFGYEPGQPIWDRERHVLQAITADEHPELPPFQGGLAGLISFELIHHWEQLPVVPLDPLAVPGYCFGLYDVVFAWDHVTNQAWLVSQGWLPSTFQRSTDRARSRAQLFFDCMSDESNPEFGSPVEVVDVHQFPAGHDVGEWPGLKSNFSRVAYLRAARRAIDYVWSGDVFQVNLAQHLWTPATCSARELYIRSAAVNAAPFGGYFDLGDWQIVSASPERLLSWRQGHVETRPIKGTRRRGWSAEEDLWLGEELQADAKEVAENTMIVDLMRNDLSRFCRDDSVYVSQWCGVERFATVMHLVSVIEGTAREGLRPLDALPFVLPGGSVSGAPKLRALEIISELEGMARGAYCGSMGYVSATGAADFNILIRTVTASRGWWHFPVGGAIVADSDPENEYSETWTKAQGMLHAMGIHDSVAR